MRRGLDLDRVALIGRTFDEYASIFGLDDSVLAGKRLLDVAGGVSSFAAEARERGYSVHSVDPIYVADADRLEEKCVRDLDLVMTKMPAVSDQYDWGFYGGIEGLRTHRTTAYRRFIDDYRSNAGAYTPAGLPTLPFSSATYDLALVSHFLFLYDERFDSAFHLQSLRELLRVSKEVRVFPLVNLAGTRSVLVDECIERLQSEGAIVQELSTQFVFARGSTSYLSLHGPD